MKLKQEIIEQAGLLNEEEDDLTFFESAIASTFNIFFNDIKRIFGDYDDKPNYNYGYGRRIEERMKNLSNEEKKHLQNMFLKKLAFAKNMFMECVKTTPVKSTETTVVVNTESESE